MQVTDVLVKANSLKISHQLKIFAGSVGTHKIHFIFEDENTWQVLHPVAVFSDGRKEISVPIIDRNVQYAIPHEVMAVANSTITIGLYGTDSNGEIVHPTMQEILCLSVTKGANTNASTGTEPTPSLYSQWIKQVEEHSTLAVSAANNAQQSTQQAESILSEITATVQGFETHATNVAQTAIDEIEQSSNTQQQNIAQKANEKLGEITTATQTSINNINATKTAANTDIQTKTNTHLQSIEALATENISEINNLTETVMTQVETAHTEVSSLLENVTTINDAIGARASGIWKKAYGDANTPVSIYPADGSRLEITLRGLTTQTGEGTPSPDNIRPMHGVGQYDTLLVLDGTENWQVSNNATYGTTRYYISFQNAMANAPAWCTHYERIDNSAQIENVMNGVNISPTPNLIFSDTNFINAPIEDWKAHLAQKHASGDPVTVIYKSKNYNAATSFYTGFGITDTTGNYRGYIVPLATAQLHGNIGSNVYDTAQLSVKVNNEFIRKDTDNIHTMFFTGQETFLRTIDVFLEYKTTSNIQNTSYPVNNQSLKCSHFRTVTYDQGDNKTAFGVNRTHGAIRFYITGFFATKEDFIAYLTSQYQKRTPVTVTWHDEGVADKTSTSTGVDTGLIKQLDKYTPMPYTITTAEGIIEVGYNEDMSFTIK